MLVSDRLRCIFIHIQKTGGSSIDRALRAADPSSGATLYGGRRHIPAREFQAMVGPEAWRGYLKFAFVRNPWDRLVSWHRMCLERANNEFQRQVRDRYPLFRDFVLHGQDVDDKLALNQWEFVADRNGTSLLDFVGRFERFAEDFGIVAARLGIDPAPPHVNRSDHGNYRDYYDADTRAVVAERFRTDIEHFAYAF